MAAAEAAGGGATGRWAMPDASLVKQGAEARIYRASYLGMPALVKERFAKKYRHPKLDAEITTRRTVWEARALLRCRQLGIDAPVVYYTDLEQARIVMELVDGETVRDRLRAVDLADPAALQAALPLARTIGKAVARLHAVGLVHGDLTTSNLMVRAGSGSLVVIDFGLTQQSDLAEDHAVDLYVRERALVSTHPGSGPLFGEILAAYRSHSPACEAAAVRLADVQLRGRKRSMVG